MSKSVSEVKDNEPKLYREVCFNIPNTCFDDILDYMESEYTLYPITKKCFGIGNDNEEECKTCEDRDDCLEECEARAERSCF